MKFYEIADDVTKIIMDQDIVNNGGSHRSTESEQSNKESTEEDNCQARDGTTEPTYDEVPFNMGQTDRGVNTKHKGDESDEASRNQQIHTDEDVDAQIEENEPM